MTYDLLISRYKADECNEGQAIELHPLDLLSLSDLEEGGVVQFDLLHTEGPSKDRKELDENRFTEFKSLISAAHPHHAMMGIAEKYLNGFLNTEGGKLFFGVEDNGRVSALNLDKDKRDFIRTHIDMVLQKFKPAVLASMYHVRFRQVYEKFGENNYLKLPDW